MFNSTFYVERASQIFFFTRLLKYYLLRILFRKSCICQFWFFTLRSLEVATRNIQQAGFISQLIQ